MSLSTPLRIDDSGSYRIVVQGHLSAASADWLEGMSLRTDYDEDHHPITILSGELIDQAALIGVIRSLYNLRTPVLSVEYLGRSPSPLEGH
jgi:hypothetical protein